MPTDDEWYAEFKARIDTQFGASWPALSHYAYENARLEIEQSGFPVAHPQVLTPLQALVEAKLYQLRMPDIVKKYIGDAAMGMADGPPEAIALRFVNKASDEYGIAENALAAALKKIDKEAGEGIAGNVVRILDANLRLPGAHAAAVQARSLGGWLGWFR